MAERLLTWVTAVKRDKVAALRSVLARIDADPRAAGLPFSDLPMLHFASVILFEEDANDPLLVFETNIDQPRRNQPTFVETFVRVGRSGLDAIYACCAGYPGATASNADVVDYLERHKRKPQLYHIGHPNRSLAEVTGDHELRKAIAKRLPELDGRPPLEILKEIRQWTHCPRTLWPSLLRPWSDGWSQSLAGVVSELETIRWADAGWPWGRLWRSALLSFLAWVTGVSLVIAVSFVVGIPSWPTIAVESVIALSLVTTSAPNAPAAQRLFVAAVAVLLIGAPFFFHTLPQPPTRGLAWTALLLTVFPVTLAYSYLSAWLRTRHFTAPVLPLDKQARERARMLLDADDRPAYDPHNLVAGVTIIRPGALRWLRRARTWLVLQLLNLFYRTTFVKGKLVTIPTIHFAQWSLIDRERLLFITNFDGAADLYLDDFFRSLALGVAFIWHETITFPRTLDSRHLKGWVMNGRTLAAVRYRAAAYDGLTVSAINNNTEIRRDLLRWHVGPVRARRWVRRFTTIPPEPALLNRLVDWLRSFAEPKDER